MILIQSIQALYAATIDKSKFREKASRIIVFGLPLLYWGRQPQWWGMGVVFLGLAVRAWGAGHLRKDQNMALGGPYLLVRHPLYLGSCLLSLGLIIALHHWFVTALVGGLTALTYWHTIRHEEKNLLARFGEPYAQYCQKVAPLWPTPSSLNLFFASFRKGAAPTTRFSWKQYLHNKEYEALLGILLIMFVLYSGASK